MTGNLQKNEVRIYLLVAVLHGLYACLYLFAPTFEWLSSLVIGVFSGSHEDFKAMFPQHYGWLFMVAIPLRIIFLVILVYIAYKISVRFRSAHDLEFQPRQLLKRECSIIVVFFAGYLLAYLVLNQLYEKPDRTYRLFQLFIARGFLFQLLVQILVNVLIRWHMIAGYLRKYLLEPTLPYNIAWMRILFFTYMLYVYTMSYGDALTTVGLTHKSALPYIGWLIDIIPVNAGLFKGFTYLGIISCFLIIAGFKTRWFLILHAICCFYVIATPNFFGKLWHNQLIIWISWFFAFAKCYDVYAIDALLQKTVLKKSADYTFPIRFIWLQFGLIYCCAGFYKLWDSGFDWALSRSMVNQVQLEWLQNYDQVPFFRIDRYPFLLCLGGLLVILFELSYLGLVLKKSGRWFAMAGGLIMHNLAGIFLHIFFFTGLWLLYFFYLDFNVFYRKKTRAVQAEAVATYSKKALYFGILILSMNGIAGMLNIDSYPFSAYPKYSALIPGKVKILRFDCGDGTDVHLTGKQNHFRWESYGWLEYNLIRDFERGKNVKGSVADYWEIWTRHNPQLRNRDSVRVFIDVRPVAPEGKDSLETIAYICTLQPGKTAAR